MKFLLGLFAVVVVLGGAPVFAANGKCDVSLENDNLLVKANVPTNCLNKTVLQIQTEIDASNLYLNMAAHFSQDTVNLPGFAELFFKAAREEREHATKLIEYLSMRGQPKQISGLITHPKAGDIWLDKKGSGALQEALNKEIEVTNSIKRVIKACESDYHFADYLTGVYLEEQYKGQRELAGKLATLRKMEKHQPKALAEFLFDKEL